MKIGIDISMLVYQGSGVAVYTDNLVKALLKYAPEHEYHLFYSSLRRPKNFSKLSEYKKLGAYVHNYRFPPRVLKFFWNKRHLLPVEWLIGKVDVFHSSDFLRPPLLDGTKGITTIHDLTWKIFPQYHTREIVEAHERKLQKTIQYGDIIIVDSNNTKKDLLKYYPQIDSKRVHVIYLGIDDRFRVIKDHPQIKKVLAKYNLKYPADYLLYVGAIEPRKNLDASIKVFAELIKDKKFSNYKFLLVGRAGWKNEKIFSLIKDLDLKDKVIFVGFVVDDDLPYFYNASKLTVYLSKYEGFGLPPLESLKCGTPVIALNNSSVKEVVPKEFLVLDKEELIISKLKHLLTNQTDIKLNDSYSWKEYTKQFLKIY